MKLLISEEQYERIFLKDIIVEQGGNWGETKTTTFKSNEPPSNISYGINPNNVFQGCRPAGTIVSGFAGTDWDWCKARPYGDAYMGSQIWRYNGNEVVIKTSSGRGDDGYQYGINDFGFDFGNTDIINDAIKTYNGVSNFWPRLKKEGLWWDSKVIHLQPSQLESLGANGIQKLFGNQMTPQGTGGVGVGNTNLFYPKPMIEGYFKLKTQLSNDIMSIIAQEKFKKLQEELTKNYEKSVKKWEKDYEKWYSVWGLAYNNAIYVNKNIMSNLGMNVNLPDKTRVENPYKSYDTTLDLDYKDNYSNLNTKGGGSESTKIQKLGVPSKLTKESDIKDFQDWLDKNYPNWANGKKLNKRVPGYGLFGPLTKKAWYLYGSIYYYNKKGKIKPPPVPPVAPTIRDLTKREYTEKSGLENLIDLYENLISSMTIHNKRFYGQSATKYNKWCHKRPGTNSPTWFQICGQTDNADEYGGVWWYKGSKNTGSCGCVWNPRQEYQGSNQYGKFYSYNLADALEYQAVENDVRGFFEKLGDWADSCIGDWHCIADVASIAVLFIPVPGLNVGLSAAIDLISAAGYAIEQDPGWKLNAGLTLVGALFSGAEFAKYTKSALKGELKSAKWVKALNDTVIEASKLGDNVGKTLTKEEMSEAWMKAFKETAEKMGKDELMELENVLKVFQKMDDAVLTDYNKIIDGLGKLNKAEKIQFDLIMEGLQKSVKKLNKFAKEIIENGYDIKKVLSKYSSRFINKDALIQASIFGLTQGMSDKIGEGIVKSIEAVKEHLGLPLDEWLGVNIDKNPNDAGSLAIKQNIEDLSNYYYDYHTMRITLNSDKYREILDKYDINTTKDIRKIVFNGINSVMGESLKTGIEYLDRFIDMEEDLISQNKSTEEIKKELQKKYDELINFLEDASKEENILKKIKKESEKKENQLTDYEKEVVNDFGGFTDEDFDW